MANLQINRIDGELDANDLQAIFTHCQDIANLLPFLIALTDEERKKKRSVRITNKGFVQNVLKQVQVTPDLFPHYLNINNFARDVKLISQLDSIASSLKNLLNQVEDTRRVASDEAYTTALGTYHYIKIAQDAGVPNAGVAYTELKSFFKKGTYKIKGRDSGGGIDDGQK